MVTDTVSLSLLQSLMHSSKVMCMCKSKKIKNDKVSQVLLH